MEGAILGEEPDAPRARESLPAREVDLRLRDDLRLATLGVLELDLLVSQFELARLLEKNALVTNLLSNCK